MIFLMAMKRGSSPSRSTGSTSSSSRKWSASAQGYNEQILLLLRIALFCTNDDPKEQPAAKDVRCMLSQIKT